MTVLIVDDARDTREMYERFFLSWRARGHRRRRCREAMQVIQLRRPDAIVLDLAMPRMTGWDVLRDLKRDARTCGIPIIVLSGQSARASAERGGGDCYLEKPLARGSLPRSAVPPA